MLPENLFMAPSWGFALAVSSSLASPSRGILPGGASLLGKGLTGKRALLVMIFSLSQIVGACDAWEIVSNHYTNYEAAKDANAFGSGGWLPLLVPKAATNIRETHDIDTNARWISFSLSSTDSEFGLEGCVDSKEIPPPPSPPRWSSKLSWWPDTEVKRAVESGDQVFECGEDLVGAYILGHEQVEVVLWSRSRY